MSWLQQAFVRSAGLAVALTAAAMSSAGCLVLSLDRYYDDLSIVFDERLLGTWQSDEDDVTITVERSDWRSYRVTYEQTVEKGTLTGYLFRAGDRTFMDLTPARGQDLGSFVVVAHAVLRVDVTGDELRAAPLAYDWFDRALGERSLPAALGAVRAEREQVLLSAGHTVLEPWLASLSADDPAFGVVTVFRRRTAYGVRRTAYGVRRTATHGARSTEHGALSTEH